MARDYKTWRVDTDLAEEYNAAVKAKGLKANEQLEELMRLWLDFIRPKVRNINE